MLRLEDVEVAIAAAGFTPRGAFHPRSDDGVPPLADGRPAATAVLAGNAGPAMWAAFTSAGGASHGGLDDWTMKALAPVALRFDATLRFPFASPPLPFQRWAMRAEACHVSPLGILIHPDYGLWHGYRGVLLLRQRLELRPRDERPSPCRSCAAKPCLANCPVDAFGPAKYDAEACTRHLAAAAGADCLALGCRARRACPVGRAFGYAPDQANFHMRHFLAACGARQTSASRRALRDAGGRKGNGEQ